MKKIKDIYVNLDKETLDMRNDERITSPIVSSVSGEIFDDISKNKKNDISIAHENIIHIEKKSGRHFDALEKKGMISSLFRMKDISIKKKKPRFSFHTYLLMLQRKLRRMGKWGLGLGFVLLCVFFLVLGFLDKIIIENRVNSGYEKLLSVKQGSGDLKFIQKNINNARFDLLLSDILFTPFNILRNEKIESVGHVISAGRHLSRGLDDTLSLYNNVENFIEKKSLTNIYFTQLLLNLYPNIKDIDVSLAGALEHYEEISWLPSTDLHVKKDVAIQSIRKIQSYTSTVVDHFPEFLNLLGHDERKRYLIVFQNADEIRPTGGFMGSMGLLEVFRGRVQLFQKKDVYAIEWDLKKSNYERLKPPKGIDELTDTFGLRDANYYSNLQDSSNNIKFFTDRAGIDLDGIVYINQNSLLSLLEITGPVYFPALDMDITSENFSQVMSLIVEAKTFKKGTLGTPKQALFDFMEIFTAKLIDDGAYFDYLTTLVHDVESRDIMMWSFNDAENRFLSQVGINGRIDYNDSFDYMYPLYTSLSGNKSDRYMSRDYKIAVEQDTDSCDFNIQTQIKSSHNMTKQNREFVQGMIQDYNLQNSDLFKIQGADRNRQFMRVILPTNSEIAPKENTEIVDYGQRKGIEFFLETPEQQSVFYDYSYTLLNPGCRPYSTKIYKQPGIRSFGIQLSLKGQTYEYQRVEEDFYFEER